MAWLPDGEKFLKMFICFDTIHECDGHTHTHRHRMAAKSALDASHGKNYTIANGMMKWHKQHDTNLQTCIFYEL